MKKRKKELQELVEVVKKVPWKKTTKWIGHGFEIAGAFWMGYNNDPFGAALAGLGILFQLEGTGKPNAGAYSYLFSAKKMAK